MVNCDLVDVAMLRVIGRHCKFLKKINLANCFGVDDACIQALAGGCRRLEDVNLSGCVNVGDVAVLALAEGNMRPGLITLNLRGCTDVSETALSWLAERCPTLLTLNLKGSQVTRNGIKATREVSKRRGWAGRGEAGAHQREYDVAHRGTVTSAVT